MLSKLKTALKAIAIVAVVVAGLLTYTELVGASKFTKYSAKKTVSQQTMEKYADLSLVANAAVNGCIAKAQQIPQLAMVMMMQNGAPCINSMNPHIEEIYKKYGANEEAAFAVGYTVAQVQTSGAVSSKELQDALDQEISVAYNLFTERNQETKQDEQ